LKSEPNPKIKKMEKIEIKSNEEINRSKLYMLTEDNEWIDQATGTPSLEKSLVYPSNKQT